MDEELLAELKQQIEQEKLKRKERAKNKRVNWTPEQRAEAARKQREYLANNPGQQTQRNKSRRRYSKIKGIAFLGGKCVDCKQEYHPAVFDFHHIDPRTKHHSMSYFRNCSWEKLQEELKKCELLCANCHRIRHHANDEENQPDLTYRSNCGKT